MDEASLYDTDILAWSEAQAAALRALAGRRDLPNALDLANVVEEIEALGRSEFKSATSPVRLIMSHLLKLAFDPSSPAASHWRTEIVTWHGDVLDLLTPSMQARVDMDGLWRRALREAQAAFAESDQALPIGLPTSCPLALAHFLEAEFDFVAAAARIRAFVQQV